MMITEALVSRIVKDVMREMNFPSTVNGNAHTPARTTAQKLPAAGENSDAITITGKVVSEAILEAAGAADRQIRLQPGAVITPSGRDYIRRHSVRLTSSLGQAAAITSGLLIAVGAAPPAAVSAAGAAGWKTQTVTSERESAALAVTGCTRGRILCCGGEASLVCCLLNRNPRIRAAVVSRTTDICRLTLLMNPQVLCLDSSGWSFGDIMRLLREFTGDMVQPGEWNELNAGGVQ